MGFLFPQLFFSLPESVFFSIFTCNSKLQIVKNIILVLPLFFLILTVQTSNAQNNVDNFIDDMLLVADNFASPGAEGAAIQSSAGWFSSARTLGEWEFEFSVHANVLFVPEGKQTKLNSGFSVIEVREGSEALLPTVFGGGTNAVFEGQIVGQEFSFDAIDGLDKKILAHPFAQLTVGLPMGTEVALRYLPEVKIDDVGFSTFGVGLKHNFNQYNKFAQPGDFQFAAAITYSNFNLDYAFVPIVIPNDILEMNRINVDADLWLVQVLASKLYNQFEVLAAAGVTRSTFDYEMGGAGLVIDPLNNSLLELGDAEMLFKGDLGFNYYFDKFKFSTMFTASSFFNVNVGLHYRFGIY